MTQRKPSRRPWVWTLAGVLVAALAVTAVVTWGGGGADETAAPEGTPTETPTAPAPSATAPPTEPAPGSAPADTPTGTAAPAQGSVPEAVVAIAAPATSSGEIRVEWQAVPGATGYRVLRTDARGATPRTVASVDITTGRTTTEPEVVSLSSSEHTYFPAQGPRTTADRSPSFHYTDRAPGERCYRAQAYNATGPGPLSAVTCASPPGADDY